MSAELKEHYMSYIQYPSNLLLAFYFPSTLIGFPLRLQPSCFYWTPSQPHFPYQSYLCHFGEHRQRDVPCGGAGGLQILVASGFYSSSVFRAGVRLRLDVMSWAGEHGICVNVNSRLILILSHRLRQLPSISHNTVRHVESMNLRQDVNTQDSGEGDWLWAAGIILKMRLVLSFQVIYKDYRLVCVLVYAE